MASLRSQVLGAYKHLLRVQRSTFAGDDYHLKNAALATYKEFKAQAHLSDPQEIQNRIQVAQQVATIIRKNVVQGQKKSPDSDTYLLKLDSDKEINDNDTIMGCGGKKKQPAMKI